LIIWALGAFKNNVADYLSWNFAVGNDGFGLADSTSAVETTLKALAKVSPV